VFPISEKPLEEREFPDEADLGDGPDEDDEVALSLVPCPACGEMVWDQVQQCPHCKQWICPDASSWRGSRKWYVRAGLYLTRVLLLNWLFWLALGAVGVVLWILEGMR